LLNEHGFVIDTDRPVNCSKNSISDLLHLLYCLFRQFPESMPHASSLCQAFGTCKKIGINLGVN